MKKITIDYLKKMEACKEGIKFFQSGNFKKLNWENFDLNKNVKGDYKNFVLWLEDILISENLYTNTNKIEAIYNLDDFPHKKIVYIKENFDKNNNRIYAETDSGYWEKREFDERNNEIYFEKVSGSKIIRKFDERNNEIYFERNKTIYFESKFLKIERDFIYNDHDILVEIKENNKTVFKLEDI